MAAARESYTKVLKWLDELGYKGEAGQQDARYVLPNAAESKIVVTMKARELLHFFRMRCCNRAQWEIREMAEQMLVHAKKAAPTIFAKSGPACSTLLAPKVK